MKSILALLLAAAPACDTLMPTRPDTFWTFRTTRDGKKIDVTWTVGKIGDEKIRLVDWNDSPKSDLMGTKIVDLKKDADGFVAVREDGKIARILNTRGDEIRIYTHSFGEYFTLEWRLRSADLADGKTFDMPRAFLSCGFGLDLLKANVASEEVTVPAGTFKAYRVRVQDGTREGESLWVVSGIGIVKMSAGNATSELAAWGVPKGGK